jgi:hypothetical protein
MTHENFDCVGMGFSPDPRVVFAPVNAIFGTEIGVKKWLHGLEKATRRDLSSIIPAIDAV